MGNIHRKRRPRDAERELRSMRQAALPHTGDFQVEYAALASISGRPPTIPELARAATKITELTPKTNEHYIRAIKDLLGPFTDARYRNHLKAQSKNSPKPRTRVDRPSRLHETTIDDLLIQDRTNDEFSGFVLSSAELNERVEEYLDHCEAKYRVPSPLAAAFIGAVIRTQGKKTLAQYCAYTEVSEAAGRDILRITNLHAVDEKPAPAPKTTIAHFTYTEEFYAGAQRLVRARQLSPRDIHAITGAPLTELVRRTGVSAENILPVTVEEGQPITAAHLAYFAYRRNAGATPEESAQTMGLGRAATRWLMRNTQKEQERLCMKLEVLAGQPLSVPYATNYSAVPPAVSAPARKKA